MKNLFLAVAAGGLLAGAAWAAPEAAKAAGKDAQVCAAGVGKPVCCKASVANHCGYVSCCEVGNAGFFSKKHCGACAHHADKAQAAAAKSASACAAKGSSLYVSCCESGNAGFFKSARACGTGCEAKKASACCSAGGK